MFISHHSNHASMRYSVKHHVWKHVCLENCTWIGFSMSVYRWLFFFLSLGRDTLIRVSPNNNKCLQIVVFESWMYKCSVHVIRPNLMKHNTFKLVLPGRDNVHWDLLVHLMIFVLSWGLVGLSSVILNLWFKVFNP